MADWQNPKIFIDNMVVDAKSLVNDNIALAKAELVPAAKNAGIGGGMFGAAGYLGANAASLLFLAGGMGIALALAHLTGWGPLASVALGFVLMAIILLVIAGILAMIGKKKIQQVGPPKQTIAEVKQTVDTVKQSLANGKNQVEADVNDRKGLAQAKKAAKDLDVPADLGSQTVATGGAHAAPRF